MKIRKQLLCLLAAAALAVAPVRASGAINLDASAQRGLVLVEVLPPPTVRPFSAVSLSIVPYDPAKGAVVHNFWNVIEYTPTSQFNIVGPTYVYADVRPGAHVIKALFLQLHWGVCYDAGTVAFDVHPGEVLFLGSIDTTDAALKIATDLPRSVSVNAYRVADVGGRLAPGQSLRLKPPTPDDMARAQAFVSAKLPGVTAPMVRADPRLVTLPSC